MKTNIFFGETVLTLDELPSFEFKECEVNDCDVCVGVNKVFVDVVNDKEHHYAIEVAKHNGKYYCSTTYGGHEWASCSPCSVPSKDGKNNPKAFDSAVEAVKWQIIDDFDRRASVNDENAKVFLKAHRAYIFSELAQPSLFDNL